MKPSLQVDELQVAKEKLTLRDVWSLAPFPATPPERNGLVRTNPFREDRHPSFSVTEDGRVFKDFARDDVRGGVWEFVALCRPEWTNAQIATHLKRLAGVGGVEWKKPRRPSHNDTRAEKCATRTEAVAAWPESVRARWDDGLAFLRHSSDRRKRIAAKRGWPVEVVDNALEMGLVGYPLLPWSSTRRGTAFLVQAPRPGPLDTLSLVPIGYHQRWWKDGGNGKPAEKAWVFVPNEKPECDRHEWDLQFAPQRCPAMPFVLGDVGAARLLVFLEGQWDAITFFHAAGWFGDAFPGRVAVFGLRGSQGIEPFFRHYAKVWPSRPSAWVIRDADTAGQQWEPQHSWIRGESFSERLQAICSRVVVSKLRDGLGLGKDFNDYWRTRGTGPVEIEAMMRSLNLLVALESQGGVV